MAEQPFTPAPKPGKDQKASRTARWTCPACFQKFAEKPKTKCPNCGTPINN